MKIKVKVSDSKIKSGKQIATYIESITNNPENFLDPWLEKYVIHNKWELKTISTDDVLKDVYFEDSWNAVQNVGDLRYDEEVEGLTYADYDQPIVLYKDDKQTLLIDGYSRTERHLWNKDYKIRAYVNVSEIKEQNEEES